MTIADHCITLLQERSPRTLEELTEECVAAGATRARNPVLSVKSALAGHEKDAPMLADGRYGFTLHLLEGRWLTTRRRTGDRLSPSFDLKGLQHLVGRWRLPLAGGGELTTSEWGDGIAGPPGWLPPERDALVGVRVTGGAIETAEIELDDAAATRGQDLADRVRMRLSRPLSWWPSGRFGHEHEVWRALVQMVAEDADFLRAPVAPLSELLPEVVRLPEAQVELGVPMTIRLPRALQDELGRRADEEQVSLDRWLTRRLEQLAWVPVYRPDHEDWFADDVELGDDALSSPW